MPRDDDYDDDDDRPRRSRRRERDDRDDDDDDRPRRRRRRDADPTGGLIPIGNGMSLAAYYCGVFSLIPGVALVLGPLAIIFGFMGLSRAKQYPEVKGKGHSIAGIVLGGLTTLGHLVVIVLLAAAAAMK